MREWFRNVWVAVSTVATGMWVTLRTMGKTYGRRTFTEVYEYPEKPVPVVESSPASVVVPLPLPEEPQTAVQTAAIVQPEPARADTIRPMLLNASEVTILTYRRYPSLLRGAGIGGTITLFVHVDTTGAPTKLQVKNSSGHEALDEAALAVASCARASSFA